jgi:hypothetical protein
VFTPVYVNDPSETQSLRLESVEFTSFNNSST